MSKYYIAALLFFLSSYCFSQSSIDSLTAQVNFQKGDSLLTVIGDYANAKTYFNQSISYYESSKNWPYYFKAKNKVVEVLRRQGELDQSLKLAQKSHKESIQYVGKNTLEEASFLHSIGIIYDLNGHFDDALKYYKKALSIRKLILGTKHLQVANSFHNIGIVYSLNEQNDSAKFYHDKALAIRELHLPQSSIAVGSSLWEIGIIHGEKSNHLLAIDYYKKALSIWLDTLDANNPRIANLYTFIGSEYLSRGENSLALEYLQKSLAINTKSLPKDHHYLASVYDRIGLIYLNQNKYDLSKKYLKKAAVIIKKKFGDTNFRLMNLYLSLGDLYQSQNQSDSALFYYRSSRKIALKEFGEDYNYANNLYNHQGLVHQKNQSFDSAIYYFKKALVGRDSLYGKKNALTAYFYNLVAEAYLKKTDGSQALEYFQKAIIANVLNFNNSQVQSNPEIYQIIERRQLINSLFGKAQAMLLANQTKNDLLIIHKVLQKCDTLIRDSRKIYVNLNDKLELSEQANKVYQLAVQVSFDLYKITGKENFLISGFNFAENGKSSSLSETSHLLNIEKKKYLPEKLALLENTIKSEKNYYLSQKTQFQINETIENSEYLSVEGKLFELNRKLDSLNKIFRSNYPTYYHEVNNVSSISLNEIQQKINEETAIIEYLVTESKIYIFFISKNEVKFKSVELNDKLFDQWTTYKQNFNTDPKANKFSETKKVLHQLYQLLIAPVEKDLNSNEIKQLLIIPDNKLHYIPFESLIANLDSDGIENYKKLNYLIQKYDIWYDFSATLQFQNTKRNIKNAAAKLVTFAPTYKNKLSPSLKSAQLLNPLKWNKEEAISVAEYFNGEVLTGQKATEESFKIKAPMADIIHFAGHAFVNEKDPEFSGIIFEQGSKKQEDDILHAIEISNLSLNAELTVLSGCNTGNGSLRKGEGVMSLAMAFRYAGVPSTIMSHWSVDDKITQELMVLFYQFLSEGYDKQQALRKAKLKVIDKNDQAIANPYFWAPFVLIGQNKSMSNSLHISLYWILFMMALPIIIYSVIKVKDTINYS